MDRRPFRFPNPKIYRHLPHSSPQDAYPSDTTEQLEEYEEEYDEEYEEYEEIANNKQEEFVIEFSQEFKVTLLGLG